MEPKRTLLKFPVKELMRLKGGPNFVELKGGCPQFGIKLQFLPTLPHREAHTFHSSCSELHSRRFKFENDRRHFRERYLLFIFLDKE